MVKGIVWLNVLLYACIVVVGTYDLYALVVHEPLPADFASVLFDALAVRLIFVVPSLVCIFGLVRRTRWGRRAAVSWNFALAFLLGVMPLIASGFAAYLAGGNWHAYLPELSLLLTPILIAVALVALAVALQTSPARRLFSAHA